MTVMACLCLKAVVFALAVAGGVGGVFQKRRPSGRVSRAGLLVPRRLAEFCRTDYLRLSGRSREDGRNRHVVRQPYAATCTAGAGHRRGDPCGDATGVADGQGSDGALSGGVGEAEVAVWG